MITMRSSAFLGLAAALVLAACGGGGKDETEAAPETAPAADAPVQVENAATINGTVSFTGSAPANPTIDMSEEQACAEKHSGAPVDNQVVVDDGKLQNVFVYVKSGLQGGATAPTGAPVLDQDGCLYKPRVVGVQVGQNLIIKNSDGILHNIKIRPTANRPFNISQPTNMETTKTFDTKELAIPVECNVHGWMKAHITVLDHPYFAVTGEDGTFKIGNLPPGTYVVEAWHEKFGTKEMSITVGPNESKDATFTFGAATASAEPARVSSPAPAAR